MKSISIRQQRIKAGLTQSELGKRIGIGQSAIAQWEGGVTSPRVDKLLLMATIFGCTVDDLVRKEDRNDNSDMEQGG